MYLRCFDRHHRSHDARVLFVQGLLRCSVFHRMYHVTRQRLGVECLGQFPDMRLRDICGATTKVLLSLDRIFLCARSGPERVLQQHCGFKVKQIDDGSPTFFSMGVFFVRLPVSPRYM